MRLERRRLAKVAKLTLKYVVAIQCRIRAATIQAYRRYCIQAICMIQAAVRAWREGMRGAHKFTIMLQIMRARKARVDMQKRGATGFVRQWGGKGKPTAVGKASQDENESVTAAARSAFHKRVAAFSAATDAGSPTSNQPPRASTTKESGSCNSSPAKGWAGAGQALGRQTGPKTPLAFEEAIGKAVAGRDRKPHVAQSPSVRTSNRSKVRLASVVAASAMGSSQAADRAAGQQFSSHAATTDEEEGPSTSQRAPRTPLRPWTHGSDDIGSFEPGDEGIAACSADDGQTRQRAANPKQVGEPPRHLSPIKENKVASKKVASKKRLNSKYLTNAVGWESNEQLQRMAAAPAEAEAALSRKQIVDHKSFYGLPNQAINQAMSPLPSIQNSLHSANHMYTFAQRSESYSAPHVMNYGGRVHSPLPLPIVPSPIVPSPTFLSPTMSATVLSALPSHHPSSLRPPARFDPRWPLPIPSSPLGVEAKAKAIGAYSAPVSPAWPRQIHSAHELQRIPLATPHAAGQPQATPKTPQLSSDNDPVLNEYLLKEHLKSVGQLRERPLAELARAAGSTGRLRSRSQPLLAPVTPTRPHTGVADVGIPAGPRTESQSVKP